MELPLSDLYDRCQQSFGGLLKALESSQRDVGDEIPLKDVDSEFDKFLLWARNVGAMHRGENFTISLDYRLRESPFYRDRVISFMSSLNENLSRAIAIISNEANPIEEASELGLVDNDVSEQGENLAEDSDSPWDVSSEEDAPAITKTGHESSIPVSGAIEHAASALLHQKSSKELPRLLEMLRFLISCLYKMPIRQPAALERLRNKLSGKASHYQHFDVLFVRDLFPQMNPTAATRLGRLISLRRHLLFYRQKHSEHLQATETSSYIMSEASQQNLESLPILERKPEIEEASQAPTGSQALSQQISMPSKATTHRNEPDGDPESFFYPSSIAPSETSRASSYAVDNLSVAIPVMPRDRYGKALTHFLCPYCSITQNIKSERAWKKHIFDDLQPYVCSYAGCGFQDHFFATRSEWYQHEIQEHRFAWHCNIDAHPKYTKQDQFEEHMSRVHESTFTADQVANLESIFRRPSRTPEGICNLCFRHSRNLRSHVSRHLQRIALFALPRTNDEANVNSAEAQESYGQSRISAKRIASVDASSHSSDAVSSYAPSLEPEQDDQPGSFDQIPDETLVPDSEDPQWDLVTPKFVLARGDDSRPIRDESHDLNIRSDSERPRLSPELLSSLQDSGQTVLRQQIEDPFPGTFEWIFSPATEGGSKFRNWLKDSGRLWIVGSPGSGKTTLIKLLSEDDRMVQIVRGYADLHAEFRSVPGSVPNILIAAHFLDRPWRNDAVRSCLRSLLLQMVLKYPFIISKIPTGPIDWTVGRLKATMQASLKRIPFVICCFLIDGFNLDYQELKDLSEYLTTLATENRHLRICTSGRSMWSPKDLSRYHHVTMQDHTVHDMSIYIRQVNDAIGSADKAQDLIDKSGGSFLWLKLAVQILQRREHHLSELPLSIEDLLQFFVETLNLSAQSELVKIFNMVVASPTPLRLATVLLSDNSRKDIEVRKNELGKLHEMNPLKATQYLHKRWCPLLQAVVDDSKPLFSKHVVYFSHDKVAKHFTSSSGQRFLRERGGPYHHPDVQLCEALLEEAKVYACAEELGMSFEDVIRVLDDLGQYLYRLDLNNTDLTAEESILLRLRVWLSEVQTPELRNRSVLGKPDFWRQFIVGYDLVAFMRTRMAEFGVHGLLSTALRVSVYPSFDHQRLPELHMVKLLLDNGADPNEIHTEYPDQTVWQRCLRLLWLTRDHDSSQSRNQYFHIVTELLNHGAERNGHVLISKRNSESRTVQEILKDVFNDLFDDRFIEDTVTQLQDARLDKEALLEVNPPPSPAATSALSPSEASFSDDDIESESVMAQVRLVRVVEEALFELESLTEPYDSDLEVVRPDHIEEAMSIREEEGFLLQRLHLSDDGSDEKEENEEEVLRYQRKVQRWSARVPNHSYSQSDSSGSDDDVIKAVEHPRRLRRRLRGPDDRPPLVFEDIPLSNLDASTIVEESDGGSILLHELPFSTSYDDESDAVDDRMSPHSSSNIYNAMVEDDASDDEASKITNRGHVDQYPILLEGKDYG